MASHLLNSVQSQLLMHFKTSYEENGTVSDEMLTVLNFTFHAPVLQSLDLVDHGNVTHLSSPSGRRVYQVIGSSGKPYTCLPSSGFCSCPYFTYGVLKRKEVPMCKHLLAVYISCCMNKCQDVTISDENMTQQILACLPSDTNG
ncbi:zinc finger SWIM domain-containing protein 7-like [Amphiura filiformis]|uniref:zinc finger SWIM domain-containing protein 7-like n=1 Tax=Amphiura filiformis TaxID=82378 RepID=UPI003B21EECF